MGCWSNANEIENGSAAWRGRTWSGFREGYAKGAGVSGRPRVVLIATN